MRRGADPILSAVVINTLGGLGFVYITNSFLVYFNIDLKIRWLLNLALLVFIPYAIFWQLFDDVWQAFLLLCILRIMVKDNYSNKPLLWVATGILAALAFFAKAYSFLFFMLNIVCCGFLITKAWQKGNRTQWIKISVIAIGTMIICSLPWIYMIHLKYGHWMTSTVFKLNLSWNLVGHPYWKDGIKYLVPPIYPNSVCYTEDPYLVNGITPSFWNSFALFKLQIVRFVYMLLILVGCMNEITCFFIVIYLLALGILISKKVRHLFPQKLMIVCLSFLLFPSGLIFKNAESRYIWYMLPLSMIIGAVALQQIFHYINNRWLSNIVIFVFALSYIVIPVMDLKVMFKVGQDDHKMALEIKKLHIHGSLTSNSDPGLQTQRLLRMAYFSDNSFYSMPSTDVSNKDLLSEMRRYHVNYYFYFCKQIDCNNYLFTDEHGLPFPEISSGRLPGLKIFEVNK